MNCTLLLILSLVLTIGCGKTLKKSSQIKSNDVSAIFSSNQISVKVFYEDGADPFAGGIIGLRYWELLEKNLEALFVGRARVPSLSVPKELSEMSKIPLIGRAVWSLQNVLTLAQAQAVTSTSSNSIFKILFVKGISDQGPNVIGYSINGENVIVIFKDVITATSVTGEQLVPIYVEQSTLVHEMGHALGLVNNGLPMVQNHQDSAHGAHCSNPNCVMYYANEGASSMVNFARQSATNLSVIMFDQQCLEDSRKF